ncbi:class I SAM-dependent methyltransferase [Methylobacterium hispanicum]|uniref:class I SAM-dependent methyltransferase n=1 Tax=Methylobacterium hispanicum TaxID=270350 RepID=UPI001EE0FB05|nr:class I SAM-dependent methyltransferase [Methylobacterium hispanicum]
MPSERISLGREHWLAVLATVGPCRLAGPPLDDFLDAARDCACIMSDGRDVDLYVAVDAIPEAALHARRIVYVSTTPITAGVGDETLLRCCFRRAVDDVETDDLYAGNTPLRIRKYERDVGRVGRCVSRRAGRLASAAMRRHMSAARQIKFGDVVLDLAGGCGFRGLMLAATTPAASVVTLLRDRRVGEARKRFGVAGADRIAFRDLADLDASLARGRFDCILCRHRQIRPDVLDAVAPSGRLIVFGRSAAPLPGFRRDADPWPGVEVWMRCPLAAAGEPVEDRYFLSARPGTPGSLDPSRMHENPAIASALITAPSRLRCANALTALALDVAGSSGKGSKDEFSALVVLGYRLLDGMDVIVEDEWLRRAADARAHAGSDAPYLRWKTSLDFVEAGLHEARGRMRAACDLYRRVAAADATEFHPSLLTKTAEAAIRAARIEMAFGDAEGARSLLRRAVTTTRATLGSDPSQIIGEEGAFTDFYMLEAAATLQMAAYAALALNLDRRSGEEALRRFLATPPKPRMIFGGPVPPPPAGSPSRPDAARRIAARLKRGLESLYLMRPPEVVSGFVMLPFD